MTRRRRLAIIVLWLGVSGTAHAASFVPFMPEEFMADQDSKRPTVVELYASSCDVCARQQAIIDQFENDRRYADVTVLRIDLDPQASDAQKPDAQKKALKQLHASVASTLIGFHGSKEIGRLVGVDRAQDIESLFASTLKR